jgi:short subunit dehydrogenase-like uncharacterized protein
MAESSRSLLTSIRNDVDDLFRSRNHDDRSFDLVVFGASGYMGRTICQYLAKNAPKSLKWCIAGRNSDKLVKVRDEITAAEPLFKNIGVIIADANDYHSLETLAKKTRLMINAAGPYSELGIDVVKACVNQQTDYLDLSNENVFTRKIIDAFHAKAQETNTLIVPACGFYSLPADMGAYVVAKYTRRKYGRQLKRIKATVYTRKEILSRGKVRSILCAARSFFATFRQILDPYYLVTGNGPRPTNIRDFILPIYYDSDFEGAQGYYINSSANEQIVRRTNQVKEYKYGPKFTYTETRTYSGRISAAYYTFKEIWMGSMLLIPPVRWLMGAIWPRWVGEPTSKQLEGGTWTMKFVARIKYKRKSDEESVPATIKALLSDDTDPNFGGSAKFVCEAALQLIQDRRGSPGYKGGVLTPASAFGNPLVERLRQAGVKIEVGEDAW